MIPPNHLLAFGGRLLHAGAANVGTTIPHLTLVTCSLNVSACGSFVQATRSALEVLYISMVLQKDTKPTWKSRWQVKTLGDSMIFAGNEACRHVPCKGPVGSACCPMKLRQYIYS